MGKTAPRVRVESGIYRRALSTGGFKYDVIWRKPNGIQSFRVANDLSHARVMRIEYLQTLESEKRAAREPVSGSVADLLQIDRYAEVIIPTKDKFREVMAATRGVRQRQAWILLAGLALAMARNLESHRHAPRRCKNCLREFVPNEATGGIFCSRVCKVRDDENRFREHNAS